MASFEDIGVSALINLLSSFAFLIAFAMFRLQPVNDRVYFPKWYLKGVRGSPTNSKFVNLDCRTYLRFLKWMPEALRMPEAALIEHAGLDSVVYIRIYLLGLKIFIPISIMAFVVLVPVNWTGRMLEKSHDYTSSNIDKLSISNIPFGSNRFWAHIVFAYLCSFWVYYMLHQEYKTITNMRLQFIASSDRRPDHFTVLVRNVPPDCDETVSEHVGHFFNVNHPEHYLLHRTVYNANKLAKLVDKKKSMQNWLTYYKNKYERSPSGKPTTKTGFCGLWGPRVDAIDYYVEEIQKLTKQIEAESVMVLSDPEATLPVAFVSFKSRWGAAVCAQTQQSRNPTMWLAQWAPGPFDVCWDNLTIPYVQLRFRKLLMSVALFFLIFFFLVPISFVQSLANIDGIVKVFPSLKHLVERSFVKSFIQGYLPGIILKVFLLLIPVVIMFMSKIEGFTSYSYLERRSASKYHLFILVNVFLVSIIAGTAFQQLNKFLHQSLSEFPKTIGVSIPMKATFFITYVMVDGWASVSAEVLRVVPLLVFHLKNTFLVKTEKDRDEAMDPGLLDFPTYEPRIQLYFLLGLVYCVVAPILLPFIVVFFAFAYLVFRHQIINVYDRKYESSAAFWPDVQWRIIVGLIISQLLLLGLLSTKGVKKSTPLLVFLPLLTICFHKYCQGRFEAAFTKFPLEEAMMQDTLERARDPTFNLRTYLQDAYLHPIFKGESEYFPPPSDVEEGAPLVSTTRPQKNSKLTSLASS